VAGYSYPVIIGQISGGMTGGGRSFDRQTPISEMREMSPSLSRPK
jgi:hypothetical protein